MDAIGGILKLCLILIALGILAVVVYFVVPMFNMPNAVNVLIYLFIGILVLLMLWTYRGNVIPPGAP